VKIAACELPSETAVGERFSRHSYFQDSCSVLLRRSDQSVVEIFHAIFGHRPAWMKAVFIVRNKVVAPFGIDTAATDDIKMPAAKIHYQVGEAIGAWPIFALSDTELIAGRDNSHLDFRLSALKRREGDRSTVTISTLSDIHNRIGRAYLTCVIPFHKRGVQWLIARAASAGRL
jgi:Protein of unknown function (DUF2867)